MANPSLQIGNSIWAIKEDDLLGYSTVGTNYLPKPITMTRASAGTRVNPQGLVETVELLGSEEITNGDFNISGTLVGNSYTLGWRSGDIGLTISNGVLNLYNNGSGFVGRAYATNGIDSYSNLLIIGKTYKISYEVTENIANSTLYAYLGSFIAVDKTVGIHTTYITATQHFFLFRNGSSNTTIKIDNVSVKEVTIENLARVDYTDGTGSLLVEPMRRNLVTYSESISNLSSTTNGTGTFTITDNYTDSPQGLQNASRVQMSIVDTNDTSNYRLINPGSVMINGITREISFYAKSLTGSNQDVLVYWSYDQQIVTLTNDWQRFKISATSGNSGSVYIGTRGGSGSYFSGGDANLDFALWGYQIEDDGSGGGSSYATSYIPTSGSTVTRVQETYEKTGISNLINSEEGVLFVEMAALSDDGTDRRITLSDGSVSDQVIIGLSRFASNINAEIHSGGVLQTSGWGGTGVTQTNNNKFAISWGSGTMKFYINGSPTSPQTGVTSPIGLNSLKFSLGNDTLNMSAKVKQLQIYKTALKDEQLKTLTT